MDLCRSMAEWHLLLWAVPASCAVLLAALGSRLAHRSVGILALLGAGWPLVQAGLATVFILWDATAGFDAAIHISWMTEPPLRLSFALDSTGVWAISVAASATLLAQIYALAAVARLAGRHRFYALLQIALSSAALFFTSRSAVVMLIGWEGMALALAFLAGFWEREQRGERTGMRWLLFQRTSGLLLLLGLIGLAGTPEMGLALLVAAAAVRAGQVPFHGWLSDSANAPAPAGALLYGTGSTLAAIALLVRFEDGFRLSGWVPDLIAAVGLAGIALGVLAGLWQLKPARSLGWLFVMLGGFAFLGFGVGDPVASMILVTSQTLGLGGLALAVLGLVDPVAEINAGTDSLAGAGLHPTAAGAADKPDRGALFPMNAERLPLTAWPARRAYLLLAAALVMPPSVGFVGMGRLLAAALDSPWAWPVLSCACVGALAGGWIAARIYVQLKHRLSPTTNPPGPSSIWLAASPAALAAFAFALGVAAVGFHGWPAIGGRMGAALAALPAGAAAAGALAGWWVGRRREVWVTGRLTLAQRIMEWFAQTGLGVGELLIQLPVLVARALGVIIWRLLGEVLIDTLILGTAYKTVEGIGIALRMLHNGRIQRYTLVVVLTVLALVVIMSR